MMFNLSLAGVIIGLNVDNSLLRNTILKNWAGFITDKKPVGVIDVSFIEKKCDITALQSMSFDGELLVSKNECNRGHYSFKKHVGKVEIVKEDDLLRSLRIFLLIIWSIYLLEKNILLMHGCGIVHNGGYLFSGPAGVGKTTIVKKSVGKEVLSDECVLLHTKDASLTSTFFSELYCAKKEFSVPLKKVFFLKQANELNVIPLNKLDFFYGILQNNFLFMVFDVCSPIVFKKLMPLASNVVDKIVCMRLESTVDSAIWDVIV